METCRIFTYSPNNIYANDYYNACNRFDAIRNKVIAYEHKTDDRSSANYKAMMNEFRYWDAKVPELSNIAGREEDRLAEKKEQKQKENNFSTSPFYKNDKLDYMA